MREKKPDLKFLKDWCITILDFLSESDKSKSLNNNLKNAILNCYLEGNKKKMSFFLKDVYSMALTSPKDIQIELDKRLNEMFGKGLVDVKPKSKKKRVLIGDQLIEAQFIKNWCIEILQYMKDLGPHKGVFFGDMAIETILKTFENNDLPGLRMIFIDTNEMARGLNVFQMKALNSQLKEKFGKSLIDEGKEMVKKITKIIDSGNIKNDEEFYLIKSYIDEFINTHEKEEINRLNTILFEYEMSKKNI